MSIIAGSYVRYIYLNGKICSKKDLTLLEIWTVVPKYNFKKKFVMQGRLKLRFVNKISFCELFLLQKQKFTFSTAGWYYLACIWFVNKSLTFPYQCSYIYSNFFNYNCKLGHLIVNGFVMNKSIFIQSVYLYWKKMFSTKVADTQQDPKSSFML